MGDFGLTDACDLRHDCGFGCACGNGGGGSLRAAGLGAFRGGEIAGPFPRQFLEASGAEVRLLCRRRSRGTRRPRMAAAGRTEEESR